MRKKRDNKSEERSSNESNKFVNKDNNGNLKERRNWIDMKKPIDKNLEKSPKAEGEKMSHNKGRVHHNKINKKLHNSVKLTKAKSVNKSLKDHNSNKLR